MSGSTDPTHGDARPLKLLADRGGRDAQLRTDLAQGPALVVQGGCTLNIHGVTVTAAPASCSGDRTLGCHCSRGEEREMAEVHGSRGTEPQQVAGGPPPIMSAQDLMSSMLRRWSHDPVAMGVQGRRTSERPRPCDHPGRGRDAVRCRGCPDKFKPQTATTITAKDNLKGNLVTLGNRSKVQKLILHGPGRFGLDDAGRGGTSLPSPHGPAGERLGDDRGVRTQQQDQIRWRD